MYAFEFLYTLLVVAVTALQVVLLFLNRARISGAYELQPSFVRDLFSAERFERMRAYEKDRIRLGIISTLLGAAILLALLHLDILGVIYFRLMQTLDSSSIAAEALYLIVVIVGLQLISLPLSLYRTFVIESRHGFNTTTLRQYIVDLVKSACIGLPLFYGILFALLWLFAISGDLWWLYGALTVITFQVVAGWLYPRLILPLFNTFTPLEDETLVDEIKRISQSADVGLSTVEQMDASKRTRHGNAFFTGMRGSKRLIVFDTLLAQLSSKELLAVIAHEFGHARRSHIGKSMIFSALLLIAIFWLGNLLLSYPPAFHAFGFWEPSGAALLALLLFASSPVFFFFQPLFAVLSRRYEYEADREATELIGESESLRSALLSLFRENLVSPRPHPWYVFLNDSHPSLEQRLEALADSH